MGKKKKKKEEAFFSNKIRRIITGLLLLLAAMIGVLSIFEGLAGAFGDFMREVVFIPLFGGMAALIPFLLFVCGWIFLRTEYKQFIAPLLAGFLLILLGSISFFTAIGTNFDTIENGKEIGVVVGGWISNFSKSFLGYPASLMIFSVSTLIGLIIFWHLLYKDAS